MNRREHTLCPNLPLAFLTTIPYVRLVPAPALQVAEGLPGTGVLFAGIPFPADASTESVLKTTTGDRGEVPRSRTAVLVVRPEKTSRSPLLDEPFFPIEFALH
jgi:hypothetical protein